MKIPHTIPQFILRAFTQKLTPEQLQIQYEGRVLRAEDPEWESTLNIKPTLAQLALDLIVKDYSFHVRLTDELNRLGALAHDNAFAEWEANLANYKRRRLSYERRLLQQEIDETRRGQNDADDDDDSDDDELKLSRIPVLPTAVPEEFPEFEPILPVLDRLSDDDRVHVIEELEFDEIPLIISINTIPDEYYWERCCNEKWPEVEPHDHGGSWKRMFIERHIRHHIEEYHPLTGNKVALDEQIDLCASFVLTLIIHSLIPACFGIPLKPFEPTIFSADDNFTSSVDDAGFEESEYFQEMKALRAEQKRKDKEREENGELAGDDEVADEDEEDKTPFDNSHIDFSLILPKLLNLKKLSIIYGMADLGSDDYEARYLEFTWQDCENLAKALALSPTIEIFELNRSGMTDEQTKLLVREGLLLMQHLKVLNLSYNKLGCVGAKAIARLICDNTSRVVHTLHTLSLCRNQIRNPGAEAIAYALTQNNHLHSLDLRLNYIRNNGACDLGHALAKNKSIQVLNLAANYLGPRACIVFGKLLRHNKSIVQLDLSSNHLSSEGGKSLVNGIRECKSILKMDVRMTNMGVDLEYEIMAQVRQNRSQCHHNLIEEDDVYPPDAESHVQLIEDEEDEEDEEEEEVEVIRKGSDDSDSDDDDDMASRNPSVAIATE